MKKQFFLNLTSNSYLPKFLETSENIGVGNMDDFFEVKDEIEVLYLLRNKDEKMPYLESYVIFNSIEKDGILYETYVRHPYKSKIIEIEYTQDEGIMQTAIKNKQNIMDELEKSGLSFHVTSVAYGKNGKLLGAGTNSDFHLKNGCIRKKLNCKSGEGYDLCEGCQPINHGERNAIKNAKQNGTYENLNKATAYMYGHYWACEPCTKAMEEAGIIKLNISISFVKEFLNIQDF